MRHHDRVNAPRRRVLVVALLTAVLAAPPAGAVTRIGGPGDDRLVGTSGPDRLAGRAGDDLLAGARGGDLLAGGRGDDVLIGGGGPDRIVAGRGTDVVAAGAGRDVVRVRDGARDRVSCGPGVDRGVADAVDDVAPDCERVRRG